MGHVDRISRCHTAANAYCSYSRIGFQSRWDYFVIRFLFLFIFEFCNSLLFFKTLEIIFFTLTGSLDCSIKLWDFNAITEEANGEEAGAATTVQKEDKFLLRSFATKNSPLKGLHFTRRNLLLAVGSYEGSS